jgi:Zn-dependent alcohol dehydrogenase
MAPSDVNNAMREQMSQLKDFIDGSSGDTITTSKIVATTATILSGASVTGTATFNSAVIMSGESTLSGGSLLKRVKETTTVSATAAANTINYDFITQSVLYYTSDATGNWVLNVRGDSSTTLNSVMSTGQSATVAFLATQGATAYYQTALQVDGSAVTPKYQGGSAPDEGNPSSIDAYVFTIIKTADATFTALGSQTQFA